MQARVLVNGKPQDCVGAINRGLAYGDGVFETILLHRGKPVFLERHLQRLDKGLARLGIADCRRALQEDIHRLGPALREAGVLKLIVTRGPGGRGYRTEGCGPPERIVSLHPAASPAGTTGIEAFVCSQPLARQPVLAGIKHLNRLEQVLASREWPRDPAVLEGVMLDTGGRVIEGTRSNIFWARGGRLHTPDLSECGVAGILREILLSHFGPLRAETGHYTLDALLAADEIFVCNSVFGVWPVLAIRRDGERHTFAEGEFTREARNHFRRLLATYED